jgi:hypothetical protein
MLGYFKLFFRNCNCDCSLPQELYLEDSVAKTMRKTIIIRISFSTMAILPFTRNLLSQTSLLNLKFFTHREDRNTFAVELQSFNGELVLVSPVT